MKFENIFAHIYYKVSGIFSGIIFRHPCHILFFIISRAFPEKQLISGTIFKNEKKILPLPTETDC